MKNEELVKELNSFPKDFQPDLEKQKMVHQNIMKFYDEYQGSQRKRYSFDQWKAVAIGAAAILVASLLFLPSLLSHVRDSNQGSATKTAHHQPAPSRSEKFHPDQLLGVKEIDISDQTGMRIKTITNQKQLQTIVGLFEKASFYSNQDKNRENSIAGKAYTIEIKDGTSNLIPVQYWPNEQSPNMLDIQSRKWWTIKGLNQVLNPLLSTSSSFNTYDEALALLIAKYPGVNWEYNENSLLLVNKGSFATSADQVWIARGIMTSGDLLTIYMDPNTGNILKEEKPESTADAKKTVISFFQLVGSGNYAAAWNFIGSRSKNPNPAVDKTKIKQTFDDYYKVHHPRIKQIDSAQWTPMWGKVYDCMCNFEKAVLIKAQLDDGSHIEVHAIQEDNGTWTLFWSSSDPANVGLK